MYDLSSTHEEFHQILSFQIFFPFFKNDYFLDFFFLPNFYCVKAVKWVPNTNTVNLQSENEFILPDEVQSFYTSL